MTERTAANDWFNIQRKLKSWVVIGVYNCRKLKLYHSLLYRSDRDDSVKKLKEHWNEENYHSFSYINKLQLIQDRVTKFKNAWAMVGWIGSYLIPRRIFFSLRGHITKFYMKMHWKIQKVIPQLTNTKTCIKYQLKQKIVLLILFSVFWNIIEP